MGERSMIEVYRGDDKIASIGGEELWVSDDQDGACRLVMALVQLGIPVDRNADNSYDFWRVQAQDPDFEEALRDYLETGAATAFGLTVGAGAPTSEEATEEPRED